MHHQTTLHADVAALLEYPAVTGAEGLAARALHVAAALPEAAAELSAFAQAAQALGTDGLEELHTRTFDHAPARALELGWHAFGETYTRGAFLVRMRELLRGHGVAEGSELPDHATLVLRLLPLLPPATAQALVRDALGEAGDTLLAGFTGSGAEANPYLGPVHAAVLLIQACAPREASFVPFSSVS